MVRSVKFLAMGFTLLWGVAASAEASLVVYEFRGELTESQFDDIPTGSTFLGTLSFDPSQATPVAPRRFIFPLNLSVEVGPYSLKGTHTGPAALFAASDQQAEFQEIGTDGAQPKYTNMDVDLKFGGAGLFSNITNDSLKNAQWSSVDLQNDTTAGFEFGLFNDRSDFNPFAKGTFTRFALVGGGPPVPEPATVGLFVAAMAGLVLPRMRKGRKVRV